MQYKNTQKIIIDKRKLDVLLRLGNFDTQLLELIKTGTFTKTGDDLVDDTLECLIDVKLFKNWGGKRDNAGRPPKNHLEKQLDNQDENQDAIQVVDKDKDKERDINKIIKLFKNNNTINGFSNNKILITDGLDLLGMKDPDIEIYRQEYGYKIILDVQNWLVKQKKGQTVDKEYIARQFNNFAYRQGVNND